MANVNNFSPVAWSIDGGRLPSDILRLLAYAATGGLEGRVQASDCQVLQTAVASQQIRITTGGVLVRNRSTGAANQTYVASNKAETLLDTPAQTTSAKSHLVVVRIKDPQYSPWTGIVGAADPKTFQYTDPFIIQNVPSTTKSAVELSLGYSAVALARIDQPANTTNITQGMIVPLGELPNPKTERVIKGINNNDTHTFFYADTDWHTWPIAATWQIKIPEWATRFAYSLALGHIIPQYLNSSATTGYLRLNVGSDAIVGDSVQWEVDAENDTNPQHILNGDEIEIPASIRGQTVTWKVQARRIAGTSNIVWHPVSSLVLDATFQERVS